MAMVVLARVGRHARSCITLRVRHCDCSDRGARQLRAAPSGGGRTVWFRAAAAAAALLLAAAPAAGAQAGEWAGQWAVRYNGGSGTLSIVETKADCVSPAWCALAVRYADSTGQQQRATIRAMDAQRLLFEIVFPPPTRKLSFEGYRIGPGGGASIAGTVFGALGRSGFYAARRQPTLVTGVAPRPEAVIPLVPAGTAAPAPPVGADSAGVQRAILPGDTVELRYPDGTRKRYYPGGSEVIHPNGAVQRAAYISAPKPTPPALPSEASVVSWLDGHALNLLETITDLLAGDQRSVDNYLRAEQGLSLYEKVNKRIRCISYLTRER